MKACVYQTFRWSAPVQTLFSALRGRPGAFLLESCFRGGRGRYSFFGSDPFQAVTSRGPRSWVKGAEGRRESAGSPLAILRQEMAAFSLETRGRRTVPPFLCGAVGFLAYDLGFLLEQLPRKNRPDPLVPDSAFGFYDVGAAYDHLRKEVTVFSSGFPERGRGRPRRARERLVETVGLLRTAELKGLFRGKVPGLAAVSLVSNFTKAGYLAAIRKVKAYIAAGDIYQVNLAQRFRGAFDGDDWQLYRRLTRRFPTSFAAFYQGPDHSILSASPELFLSFDGSRVTTRPMKGTRRRAADSRRDRALKKELRESRKEKAELLMIVDLERNDLGRVCSYRSIKVGRLRQIETYAGVYQATAEVEGLLHRSKDRIDLLRACFPGGSVTGCPKIRAMEIIEEIEPDARGIYTGSLGYLSFHNTLQFNMLIRSFLCRAGEVSFHVGGGIVADSRPQDEYEETLIKGRALREALGETKEGR
jgi:para-aminobenzoate synthetase component 1